MDEQTADIYDISYSVPDFPVRHDCQSTQRDYVLTTCMLLSPVQVFYLLCESLQLLPPVSGVNYCN